MRYLLLTVEFLDDRYHGLLDRRGPPEWPPSPFRLFSALVSGAARRGALDGDIGKALAWLQSLGSPTIIAPASKEASGFTRHVPNNDGDEKFDRQERLTGKQSIPTLMLTKAGARPQVHYFWQVSGRTDMPFEHIRDVARSLVALGWGVDMAFADARVVDESDLEREPGVRWHPTQDVWRDYGMLRVPTGKQDIGASTLLDLKDCYESWIARVEHGKPLHAAKEPNVYDEVFYASAERPIGHPYRVFELRDSSGDLFRYPHRKLIHIAGMVRHLAVALMKKDPPR
ncbi:MAG: type I-U CRISPR-associated protein Cas5/Cas6, partial [Deltaproteobacteria bacterium]|nr:type I-U CRISPR-associated protein Cas5/Cas6 [Deltaproteobacteria bacterium]